MKKHYCIQNIDHGAMTWTRISWPTESLDEARADFKKSLKSYMFPKDKSFRLVSFVVTDPDSDVFKRPAEGCVILDVLEFYAGGQ